MVSLYGPWVSSTDSIVQVSGVHEHERGRILGMDKNSTTKRSAFAEATALRAAGLTVKLGNKRGTLFTQDLCRQQNSTQIVLLCFFRTQVPTFGVGEELNVTRW